MLDRARIVTSIKNFYRGSADILVFVFDEFEHRIDDAFAANAGKRI